MSGRLRPACAITLAALAWAAEPAVAATSFESPRVIAAGGLGSASVTRDFDGDGNLDVATAAATIRYGDGAGGFQAVSMPTGAALPLDVESADFDEDLRPDLAAAGFPTGLSVFLSDSTGGFEPRFTVTGSATGGDLTAGDFDGDGHQDLAALTATGVRVFRGDGAGAFAAGIDFTEGHGAGQLAAADLDGNDRDDLIATDLTAGAVQVLRAKSGPLTTGPGGLEIFDAPVAFPTAAEPRKVVVADLDGDGKRDLVVRAASLQVLYGDGAGALGAGQTVTAGPIRDVIATRLDGDAIDDLVVGRPQGEAEVVSLVLGRSDRQATVVRSFATGLADDLTRLAAGDFDDDGSGDVIAESFTAARRLPGQTLTATPANFGLTRIGRPVTRTVTIHNPDLRAYTITGGNLDGNGFTTSGDGCTAVTLQPGDSCTVAVTFDPSVAETVTGRLSMSSDAPNSPHRATLSAQAVDIPVLALVFRPTAFGSIPLGASSGEHFFSAANNGEYPLQLSSVELGGADKDAFKLRTSCATALLDPAQGCNVWVRFTPRHLGTHTAALYFLNDGRDPEVGVTLIGSGSGEAPNPEAGLSPAALNFGRVKRGASVSKDVQLRNTGNIAFAPGALQVSPKGGFSARQTGCELLDPGQSCRVTVRFRPGREGAQQSTVTFAGLVQARFSVRGTGYNPIQPRQPLLERLTAAIAAWRGRGIEGVARKGVRVRALAVELAGKAGLQVSGRRKGRTIVVAQGLAPYPEAGTGELLASPTKGTRALFKGLTRVTLRARLRFRTTLGELTEVVKTFVVRRLTRKASFASCSASPARNLPSASPPPRSGCSPSG